MKIKSTVWQLLAGISFVGGAVYALGIEGGAQVGGTISDGQFLTALGLILLAVLLMRISFAAEARERRAAHRRYGRISRNHARNTDYPELPECSRRGA